MQPPSKEIPEFVIIFVLEMPLSISTFGHVLRLIFFMAPTIILSSPIVDESSALNDFGLTEADDDTTLLTSVKYIPFQNLKPSFHNCRI